MVTDKAPCEGGGGRDVAGTEGWRIEDTRETSQYAVLHVPNEPVEFSRPTRGVRDQRLHPDIRVNESRRAMSKPRLT